MIRVNEVMGRSPHKGISLLVRRKTEISPFRMRTKGAEAL